MELNLDLDPRDPRYQQLVAKMIREGKTPPPSSGMAASGFAPVESGSKPPGGTVEGRQAGVDAQRKIAEGLRGRGAPKGRTAGPYDVYYGPNIGETLAHAGEQLMGGYMAGQAADEAADIDIQRGLEKAAAAKTEQDRHDAKVALETRGVVTSEGTLKARQAADAQKILDAEADRKSRESIAGAGQSGQNRRDNTEMVYINEDGTPDYSKTRFANPSAKGMVWGNGEVVDEDRWQGRNDPNLTAATSTESRGTSAQKVAQYRANTFGDALTGLKATMGKGGYDPTTGRAFIDKYANQNDMFRWASTAGGQKYNSDASTVKEAALRTSTGAAAPNKENGEYMVTLIPGPWDTPSTVDFKVAKLEGIHTRLLELAGIEGTTQADLDAESDLLIENARAEETAIKDAVNKAEGEEWEDKLNYYRKINGEVQASPKGG